jgi:hydrogenase small subunit
LIYWVNSEGAVFRAKIKGYVMSVISFSSSGISRRHFLRYCAYLAALLGFGPGMIPSIAKALETIQSERPSVIWIDLQGATESIRFLLGGSEPTVEEVIFDCVSLDFYGVLQAASGTKAQETLESLIEDNFGAYTLVTTGGVPKSDLAVYAMTFGEGDLEILKRCIEGAVRVISVEEKRLADPLLDRGNPAAALSVSEAMELGLVPSVPLTVVSGCEEVPQVLAQSLLTREMAIEGDGRVLAATGNRKRLSRWQRIPS